MRFRENDKRILFWPRFLREQPQGGALNALFLPSVSIPATSAFSTPSFNSFITWFPFPVSPRLPSPFHKTLHRREPRRPIQVDAAAHDTRKEDGEGDQNRNARQARQRGLRTAHARPRSKPEPMSLWPSRPPFSPPPFLVRVRKGT